MISLTKIIDPLAGYIAKVQKDVSDRDKERQQANPRISGAARLLSAEQANQAAYVNRLTAEINEIKSGLRNMRDGLGAVEVADSAYNDVLNILDKMQTKVTNAQRAEDLNTAVSSDSTSLATALSSYNAEINSVVTNRQFNSQNLIDGTFTNRVFPLWSGETNSPSISLEDIEDTMSSHRTFSALALDGDLQAQISGNSVSAGKTISIDVEGDAVSFDQLAGESASSLAARINLLKARQSTDIGVSASVRSSLRLNDLSSAGTLEFRLYSEKQGTGYQSLSSIVVSDKTDLSAIASAVNGVSDKTGVFAKMGNSNQDIILRDPNGGNIAIRAFDHSVTNATITTSVDRRDGLTDFALSGEDTNTSNAALYGTTSVGFADSDSAGSVKFDHVGNLTSDNILLATKTGNANSAGNITIDASKNIYFGNGSDKTLIGEVDSTHNGIGGNALQINFKQTDDSSLASRTLQFANNTFASSGDWTSQTSQIKSGVNSLGSIAVPTDSGFLNSSARSGTLTVNSGTNDDTISAITVDGTNLIASTITYVDNTTTAAAIRTAINNRSGTTSFTATGSGAEVIINKANAPSNSNINLTKSDGFVTSKTNIVSSVDEDQESITNASSPFATSISSGKVTMTVSNATTDKGYSIIKGAALISDDYVAFAKGEKISFDWTAVGQNSDKYDIQAYLVSADGTRAGSNNIITSVGQNKTGSGSASGTATFEVTSAGDYKFAFITGAYDADGDGDASATATLDNVVVSHFSENMVDIIKNRVTFENLSFSASASNSNPQVTVATTSQDGSTTTDTLAVPPTLAGYALTAGSDQEIFATGEVTIISAKAFSVTQQDASNNGSTFWDVATPSVASLKLLSGAASIGTENSLTLDNASERVALAIKNVTDYKDKYLAAVRSMFDFGDFNTSNYLDSLNTTKASTLEPVDAINLTQKTAEMIISDEISKLLAKAGNASADDVYALIKST